MFDKLALMADGQLCINNILWGVNSKAETIAKEGICTLDGYCWCFTPE